MNQSSSVQASESDHEPSYFRFWALRAASPGVKSPSVSLADSESISPYTTKPPTGRRPLPQRTRLSSSYQQSDIGPAIASREHSEHELVGYPRHESPNGDSTVDTPTRLSNDDMEISKAARVVGFPTLNQQRLSSGVYTNKSDALRKPHFPRRHAYYPSMAGQVIYEGISPDQGPQSFLSTLRPKHQITLPFCTVSFGRSVTKTDSKKQEPVSGISTTEIPHGVVKNTKQSPQLDKRIASPLMQRQGLGPSFIRSIQSLGSREKHKQVLKRVQTLLVKSAPQGQAPKRVKTNDTVGNMLVRVSTILHDLSDHSSSKSTSDQGSDRSIASGTAYQNRYRNPRSRRNVYNYPNNGQTDSLLNINEHRRIQNTPDDEALYWGSDGNRYLKVDITNPNGPTYLPSEAKRVQTPPLKEVGGQHKRRGFFFDYHTGDDTRPSSPRVFSPKPTGRMLNSKNKKDWYEALEAALEVEDNIRQPEVDVPDHLPTSPLCPRHPKHKLRGRGVCPMHGRNNSMASMES